MKKKKFDLTSDIVKVDLEEGISNNGNKVSSDKLKDNPEKKENAILTISVDVAKRTEFKTWCAKNNLKMNEAFLKGFELLKKEY